MPTTERKLLSGNEAVALAALHSGVALGTGYPGTPSSEILEALSALGAAFAKARAMATMKHVGLNVAADPLFTAAYTGVSGALVAGDMGCPAMCVSGRGFSVPWCRRARRTTWWSCPPTRWRCTVRCWTPGVS